MSLFDLIALVITVTAALGYLNRQLLGLPTAIGVRQLINCSRETQTGSRTR